MNRRHVVAWGLLAWAVGLSAIACGGPTAPTVPPESAAGDPVDLTVSAAASVQDALKEVQSAYASVAANVTITYNFGSSGSLAQQIAQGAPSDVFLAASPQWMDDLEAKDQILAGSRRDLLRNSMVLIVPQDNTTVADFQDLARVGKIAIGEPQSVPAGGYAKEVLTTLTLFEALQPKLVFGQDVRQVLAYVETGNVDAGLVYATDVIGSDQVRVVATAPADSHAPISYPVAVVQASEDAEAAQAFVDFLSSQAAIAIFQRYGFGMAE
ncbi:MAG: molybdate ABC transporter substrate-binding protein [Nodosilinea sp.]